MNKAALALKLSERLQVSKKLAEDFIHTFQDVVTETLAHDEEVTIAGFGTFSSRIRARTIIRNDERRGVDLVVYVTLSGAGLLLGQLDDLARSAPSFVPFDHTVPIWVIFWYQN